MGARLLPTGAETLTGRVHRLYLPPLAVGEVLGGLGRLLPALLESAEPPGIASSLSRTDYFDLIVAGGYPAALRRATPHLRSRWFASYLSSVAERDVPQLADIRYPGALAKLYRLVARQTSGILNRSAVGEQLAMGRSAASAYLDLLSHVYLVSELPGWTAGVSAKEGRRPKVQVTDTGLAAAAIGMDAGRLASGGMAGAFMENFVIAEVSKQLSIVDEPLTLAHFRDRSGVEVDLVIERADGRVIGVEVKSATSINGADARGLTFLRDRLRDRFQIGVVLYTGSLTGRLGDRIWASPVSALWGGDTETGG
jgi:predicted AAA+ superfamily ATPase